MKHIRKGKTLGRKAGPRRALLKNLAASLILYEKIKTTEAKAKLVRPLVEKMVTRAKTDNLHNRRELIRRLPTENSVKKLLEVLGPRYKDRRGGYIRIIKLSPRQSDGAKMVQIEFVK